MWNKQKHWTITEPCFESRLLAGGTENLRCSENIRISSWSFVMEGHAKMCVERYREVANKTTQQLYTESTPCIDDPHFKEEAMKSEGEFWKVCSPNVLNAETWHELDDLIFYGQCKLARLIKKMDQGVWQTMISLNLTSITYVKTYRIVMWVILLNNTGWDCCKTPTFREILRTQKKIYFWWNNAFLEIIHLFQSVECVRTNFSFTVDQN